MHELTGAEPDSRNRKRKGIFNSIGFGLKILFGTMDSDDAEYYNEKISTIDSNQGRVYQLEKGQLTLVRRTLADVKHTLKDINTNVDTIIHSQVLLEELKELTKLKIDTYQEQLNVYNKIVSAILELANKEIDRLVTDYQPYNLFEILPVPTPPQGLEDSRLYTVRL